MFYEITFRFVLTRTCGFFSQAAEFLLKIYLAAGAGGGGKGGRGKCTTIMTIFYGYYVCIQGDSEKKLFFPVTYLNVRLQEK